MSQRFQLQQLITYFAWITLWFIELPATLITSCKYTVSFQMNFNENYWIKWIPQWNILITTRSGSVRITSSKLYSWEHNYIVSNWKNPCFEKKKRVWYVINPMALRTSKNVITENLFSCSKELRVRICNLYSTDTSLIAPLWLSFWNCLWIA